MSSPIRFNGLALVISCFLALLCACLHALLGFCDLDAATLCHPMLLWSCLLVALFGTVRAWWQSLCLGKEVFIFIDEQAWADFVTCVATVSVLVVRVNFEAPLASAKVIIDFDNTGSTFEQHGFVARSMIVSLLLFLVVELAMVARSLEALIILLSYVGSLLVTVRYEVFIIEGCI